MNRLFLDTDVLMDLLTARKPHIFAAQELFTRLEENADLGFASGLSFATLHYMLRKINGSSKTVTNLARLRSFIKIVSIDDGVIDLALGSDFKDFEDAIQYYAATHSSLTHIITRNVKDYKLSKCPVLTPAEYLATLKSA